MNMKQLYTTLIYVTALSFFRYRHTLGMHLEFSLSYSLNQQMAANKPLGFHIGALRGAWVSKSPSTATPACANIHTQNLPVVLENREGRSEHSNHL